MKKVLIITYYWPPASSPGVFRFVKFARYLPDFGFQPIILTVKNGSYPSSDETLIKEIDPDIKVYKTKTIEPFTIFNKLQGKKGKSVPVGITPNKSDNPLKQLMFIIRANLFIPDARKGWNRFAYRKAKKIIREHHIHHIITTGPPHSTHLTGLKLQKQTGVKWIADLRDPWTNIYYNQYLPRTKKTKKKDLRLENSVLKHADLITVVSNGMKQEFENRARKIEIIQNGFDKQDIPEKPIKETSHFIISYIGNLKSNQHIPFFWDALNELARENRDFVKDTVIQFVGNIAPDVLNNLAPNKFLTPLQLIGHVPHREAVQHMMDSNLLLFIVPMADNNKMIITGKLFEYLASQSPILSIGPTDGDASKLLEENQRDAMIDYNDKEKIKSTILHHYQQWKSTGKLTIAPKVDLWKYSRKGLTEKLSTLLHSI